MILVKPTPRHRRSQRIKSISHWEIAFVLVALAFVTLVFVYADHMRAAVSGENYLKFSVPSGFYDAPFALTLDPLGRRTEIHYTVDGTNPDGNAPRYTTPIPIDKTTVLKAIALRDGEVIGKLQTQTYFINESSTLPVVSLITDPADLWDPKTGIYVLGTPDENSQEKFVPNDMRRGPEWHRMAYLEFFDATGKMQFALEGDIRIHGNTTRRFPQKSLRFCATGGKYMEYKFFKDSTVDEFKCILLRNGGNDWKDTMFRDSLVQSLVSDTSLDIQHSQPAIVFLNGEYWGIHNIRDTYNDYYFHTKYGLDRGGIVMLFPDREQGGYPVVEEGLPGDEMPYLEMLQFVQDNDMTVPSNYAHVQSLMDVDNYIDYMILNIYASNGDWGDSNLRIWRYENETGDFRDAQLPYGIDGRWRWIVYDMDNAMAESSSAPMGAKDSLDRAINAEEAELEWATVLFKNLLKNDQFRNKFIHRFIYHYNVTFQPERVINRIDEYQARLRPEIERHIGKWGGIPARSGDRWISFKNVEEWEQRVEVMRDFAVHRQDYALDQLATQFALAGTTTLRVKLSAGGLAVHIGDLRVAQDGWTGEFVKGLTYPIHAESQFGYNFVGWESTAVVESLTELRLADANVVELTAQFEKNLFGQVLSAIGLLP